MTRWIAALVTLLAVSALAAPAAHAATFTVDDAGDAGDANTADATCATAGAVCTLRAAVQQANFDSTSDDIHFNPSLPANTTIDLGASLDVSQPVTIDGCNGAAATSPCVGIRRGAAIGGNNAINAFADSVTIKGLAITRSGQGIFYGSGRTGLIVQNCWFGTKVDGAAEAVQLGISAVGDSATIGGTSAQTRNVFSNGTSSNSAGIQVFTGDNNTISGNYFGVEPSGSLSSTPFTDDIEVVGNGSVAPDDTPDNTVIGGLVSPAALTSTSCDGACNVISHASANGIDLVGEPSGESRAGQTTIAGNFIGLDPAGGADFGNADGIRIGGALNVTVGGAADGDRNYLGGNDDKSVEGGSATTDIERNFIGDAPNGTVVPDQSVSADLGNGVNFSNNRVVGNAVKPDVGLKLPGNSATVFSNVFGRNHQGGNFGMPVAIFVQGSNNTIGDGTTAHQNEISNTTQAGILVTGASGNSIGLNFGINNTSPSQFIDLGGDGPGNSATGPNAGAQAPTITAATPSGAAGLAPAGSTVRIFKTSDPVGGPLRNIDPVTPLIASTVADGSGNWSVTYGAPLSIGDRVAATQTTASGTSEFSFVSSSLPSVAPPAPAAGAAGAAVGIASLSSKSLKLSKSGSVSVGLSCQAQAACEGTLALESARKVNTSRKAKLKLGSARFSIAAGKSAKVKIKLSSKNARLVRKLRKLKVKATISVGSTKSAKTLTLKKS